MAKSKSSKTRLERAGEMFALISRYENGTETQQHFCERNDLKSSTFGYWLKKYRSREPERNQIGFVPLKVRNEIDHPHGNQGKIEVTYPEGTRLSFGTDVDVAYVRGLLPSFNKG